MSAVNSSGYDIFLAAHNIKEAKNTVQTEVYMLKEMNVDD